MSLGRGVRVERNAGAAGAGGFVPGGARHHSPATRPCVIANRFGAIRSFVPGAALNRCPANAAARPLSLVMAPPAPARCPLAQVMQPRTGACSLLPASSCQIGAFSPQHICVI